MPMSQPSAPPPGARSGDFPIPPRDKDNEVNVEQSALDPFFIKHYHGAIIIHLRCPENFVSEMF
ncbi:hypothetical protein GP486_006602 [Trichoglossum hirsutum]|uniref:Uncharacterized protein n=1 Tax=Trichoglossum hirsutum TaxID=265104 RepID=A0A9P8L7B2_9PEZI|nr:hypothetical protein GP486_006602 [Trichoglossum hirsutum]